MAFKNLLVVPKSFWWFLKVPNTRYSCRKLPWVPQKLLHINFTKAPFSIKEVFIVTKRSLLLSKGPYSSHKIPDAGRKRIVPKSVLTFFSMPILRLRSHRFSVESLSKFCCCLARSKSSWTVVVPVVNDVDVDVGDAGAAAALNKEARHEQALKLILN